jgi:hypothetical protein
MFLGHFAVGMGAKKVAPEVSLGTLFLAAQLADLLWPLLVLAGVERVEIVPGATVVTPLDFVSYPWSHSLLALAACGALLAVGWLAIRRGRPAAALVLFATVVSHWILDVASHRPDMPITLAGTRKLGLGLWDSLPATLVVEALLFAGGIWLYVSCTRARDRVGRLALAALLAFLAVVYVASVFGPPPPSARAIGYTGLAMWLLVLWASWADRHREPRIPPRTP